MTDTTATILVSSADPATRRFISDNLAADGFSVLEASAPADAERLLAGEFPDLAILDVARPDHQGLELVARVRRSERTGGGIDPDVALLVLSGRASELDRLRAFERGADDFVPKPFSYGELRARSEALLRRVNRRPTARRLRIGELVVDPSSRQAWLGEEALALSNKEFSLLRALAAEPTRVFTRDELLRGVWGFQSQGRTRTLDTHAARLRQKLGAHGARFLVNVWGVGYRLIDGELEDAA